MPSSSRKSIEGVRARIEVLKAEDAELRDAPPSVAETRTRLHGYLSQHADSRRTNAYLKQADYSSLLKVRAGDTTIDLAPMLVAILGAEFIGDALMRHLRDVPLTSSSAERHARRAAIASELFEAECEEEALIEASEAAGTPIARRADCDPRAVLGVAE